jgi:hypothetical protein
MTEQEDQLARLERRLEQMEAAVGRWTQDLTGVPAAVVLAFKLDQDMRDTRRRLLAVEKGGQQKQAENGDEYEFAPQVRWHELDAAAREAVLARVRLWVDQVYRPQFTGAPDLLPCWDQHVPCVLLLDVLSEVHRALTYGTERNYGLAHNLLELFTRGAREAGAVLRAELNGCGMGHTDRDDPRGGGWDG